MTLHVRPPGVAKPSPPGGARIVDEQMKFAVVPLDRLAHRYRRLRRGQVGGHHGRAAELLRQPLQPLSSAGDQHEPDAGLARETAGGCLADAARGARDHGDAI